jgi:hypothetical protein
MRFIGAHPRQFALRFEWFFGRRGDLPPACPRFFLLAPSSRVHALRSKILGLILLVDLRLIVRNLFARGCLYLQIESLVAFNDPIREKMFKILVFFLASSRVRH